MPEIRIILLCSSRLALPALQQFAFMDMLAAVVVPIYCVEVAEHIQFLLKDTNMPILLVDKTSYISILTEAIPKYGATLGLMITFSFLIPAAVYTLPTLGFYNVHPGPLPQYRGADPIFQQIKNKEKRAGVTIHQLNETFDTGPVVMQEMIKLLPSDTYGMLTTKLAQVAARLTLTLMKLQGFDTPISSRTQDETKANYYFKHKAKEVAIDWNSMDAASIVALINACNPWNKGATTQLNGRIVRLLEAIPRKDLLLSADVPPGTILAFQENTMLISTAYAEAIAVSMIYTEDGFTHGGWLAAMGVAPGYRFENIF